MAVITDDVMHYFQSSIIYFEKGNITWANQHVKENKITMMIHVRVELIGSWKGSDKTNFLKWLKMKVVVLHYSFLNMFGQIMFWSAPILEDMR